MSNAIISLKHVYDGWGGYRQSISKAIRPLTAEQLTWRPATHLRSVGEVVRHIAFGPIDWFVRMDAPGSRELAKQIDAWEEDQFGIKYVIESAYEITAQASELVSWLEASEQMIENTLGSWTVDDLKETYQHTWRGDRYDISRQWTIWRIMAHDIHHGGEFVMMLGMQGIKNFELGDLGGHVVEPPLAES